MFLSCLQVRLKVLPSDHEGVANSYNILGKVYVTKRQHYKVIELYQKAVDIDMTRALQHHKRALFIRHLNMATAQNFIGDSLIARQHLD